MTPVALGKRPLTNPTKPKPITAFIDLTLDSDDEPPPKRQKSETPAVNGRGSSKIQPSRTAPEQYDYLIENDWRQSSVTGNFKGQGIATGGNDRHNGKATASKPGLKHTTSAQPLRGTQTHQPIIIDGPSNQKLSQGREEPPNNTWKQGSYMLKHNQATTGMVRHEITSSTPRYDTKQFPDPCPSPRFDGRIPLRPSQISKQSSQAASTGEPLATANSKKKPVVNIPPPKARAGLRRKAALEELKKDTAYAKEHRDELDRLIGRTGFSSRYDPGSDTEQCIGSRPKKLREVDRAKIPLPLLPTVRVAAMSASSEPPAIVHPREQIRSLLTNRFSEKSRPPLTFQNENNHLQLDGKFQFIFEYVIRKGVKRKDRTSPERENCRCLGTCELTCACFRKTLKDHLGTGVEQINTYYRRPDGLVVLSDAFIDRWSTRVEILECNDQCSCSRDCGNRVVQRGRTVPLEIFETGKYGFGVRSLEDLVRGQFIELYLGEVITEAELSRREDAAEEDTPSYVYSLDRFASETPTLYHVDGSNFGSAIRFVNHSCKPNSRTYTVMNPHGSKQLHLVGFFAISDIPAGTEITIDYDPRADMENQDIDDSAVVRCRCGEPNCRGRLWAPAKVKRARKRLIRRDSED